MNNSFKYPWDSSRIILVCGTGGVGKTTVSAAMGLDFARRGFKTMILTIDPAKRLAEAMGIGALDSAPQKIKISAFGTERKVKYGELYAMMLNTKRMFDKIIEKYSPNEKVRISILKHPLYNHLSNMLAGSQEYMAMENLYCIATEYDFEKIIVDTPPTVHALDFLDAPEKMTNALTNSMLKLLVRPAAYASEKGNRLFQFGAKKFMSLFGDVAGIQFLQEMADFLASTISLLDGFKERAEIVSRLLSSSEVTLLLVTSPSPAMIADSEVFLSEIKKRGLSLSGCILNRAFKEFASELEELKKAAELYLRQRDKESTDIGHYINFIVQNYEQQEKLIEEVKGQNPDVSHFLLPLRRAEIHNLKGLAELYSTLET